MGLLEDVVINTKSAINTFGKKATEMVDVSKLKISAIETNNKIAKEFENLGKKIYHAHKDEKSTDGFISDFVCRIDSLYDELEKTNEKIAITKNQIKCKACGFINLESAIYCCKCGFKLSQQIKDNNVESDNTDNPN